MIAYLHGFNSSPASGKARLLGEHMASLGREADYYCPALPNSPREAVAFVEADLAQRHPQSITLVGSSLGGFYATYLAERHGWKAVLVNPAVHAHLLLRDALGPQENWHTGETWELTEAHLAELAALDVPAISRPERYLLLAQTGDEVLDYREAVAYYAGARQIVETGGDHGFVGFERHFQTILDF
ncbi:esterase [Thiobacillus denitrificans ATCC 25259]|uniref:Esterase n=1 Tax=Thiobacillus denitrificans (strain ATCC 25259 / T1) TaxID=292415 RepID=Q3SFS9_THIDA|nr:YqiA/YcfP family alpha/beta fold hydrolase [Thiobacillus denitrificans]AAZ98527.1 esterase [Thiobacillus denitrificans ATCC 25259]